MEIKSVEMTGFKGTAPSARFDFETFQFSPHQIPFNHFPLFFYKAVFGILFGFSEEQKKKFRIADNSVKTFTGLVHLKMDNSEFLVERDFETNFVAWVRLQTEKIKTIYQGKDIISNGSHKRYLKTFKNQIPDLILSLNKACKKINALQNQFTSNNRLGNQDQLQERPANVYTFSAAHKESQPPKADILPEDHPYLFYEIFNKARDAIMLWRINPDLTPGTCIEANRAACALTGYSLEELRQKSFLDLKPDFEKDRIQGLFQALLEKGHLKIETVNETKEGKIIDVEINAHTFTLASQPVILSVTRDISERKYFETELLKSTARYKALFENASDAVFLLEDNQIIDCNKSALRLLKLTKKKMIGKAFDQFCTKIETITSSKKQAATFSQIMIQAQQGQKTRFYCCIARSDGKILEAEGRAELLGLEGKKIVQLIVTDLTEIKKTQRALLKKNLQYQNFIQNSLVGIWQLEFPEPIPIDLPVAEIARKILHEGRFVEVNDALVQMYHKQKASDIIGQAPAAFSVDHEASIKTLSRFVQNNFRMDLHENVEKINETEQKYFTNSYFGYVEDGKLQWMWGLQIDISQQKELEEQFLHSQKMEAIGMLAGGIAHDFNNILTVINGYADMLTRGMKADDPLFKYIGQIRQAGERASNLTSQLLSFSRRQVFQTQVIDLNALISGMISMIQRIIGEHIEVITRLSADLFPIQFDASKIEQIILNMAVNAKDAMPRGGKLFIETKNVVLDAQYCARNPEVREGEYALLTIGDTGMGMDEHILKHIFEPFFTTKEKGVGTGLGLATVYGIVKQAKGHITVRSQVGQGTTFSIYFPKASTSTAIIEEIEEDDVLLMEELKGDETILVVEDDPTVRQVIVETLYNYGYRVLEAMDGQEAQEIFALSADQIDLIVSDIVMPRVNGVEFHLQILKRNPDVKFIFISGYSDNEILIEAELNSVEFIQKPFKLNELVQRVRKVLNRSQHYKRQKMN